MADQLPPVPQWKPRNGIGDILDNLFLGGNIQSAREADYKRQVENYQLALDRLGTIRAMRLAGQATGDDAPVAQADPAAYLKIREDRITPKVLKADESEYLGTRSMGQNGFVTAPKSVVDNGRVGEVRDGAFNLLGNTGPHVLSNGIDERTGQQFPVASTLAVPSGSTPFNVVSAGNARAQPLSPALTGSAVPPPPGYLNLPSPGGSGADRLRAIVQSAYSDSTGAAGTGAAVAPRSIRNNNPGNLRALPGGRVWNGQTGIDSDGYAIFARPDDGQAAAMKNIGAYAKRGIGTVARAIGRWAPQAAGNNVGRYASYVARTMGVGPQDPIDLNDPSTAGQFFQAIAAYEAGPKARRMQVAAGGPLQGAVPPPAQSAGADANGFSGASATPLAAPRTPHLLQPGDPRLKQFAPGQAVQEGADGTLTPVQGTGFTPEVIAGMRKEVYGSPEYRGYSEVVPLVRSMRTAMKDPSAAGDLNLIEAAGRTFNPNAVVRQGTVKAFQETQGIPDIITGALAQMNRGGTNARLSPQTRQAITRQVESRAQQLRKALQPTLDAYGGLAKRNGVNPSDILPPVDEIGPAPPSLDDINAELASRGVK